MRKKLIPILVAMLLIIVVAAVGIGTMAIKKYSPSDKKMDGNQYYGISHEDEVAVILQNQVSETKGKLIDGRVYLNYETVGAALNKRFYWDKNEGKLLYTTPTDIITIMPDSSTYQISGQEQSVDYSIFRVDGDQGYLALDFVKLYTDMDYKQYDDPKRIMIWYQWGEVSETISKDKTAIRYKGGIKSDIITEVPGDTPLLVIMELDEWLQVASPDGYIGYVQKKHVGSLEKKNITSASEVQQPEYTSQKRDHKINLAWHQVTSQAANASFAQAVANMKGVNVISPTWFSVTDNSGAISSLVSEDYLKQAHQMGLEVWGLVDNFSNDISTFELLSHTKSRTTLIQNLITTAVSTGIDGINVDFEKLKEEDGPHFIQFIRELSIQCRKNNLVLSVDNPVPAYTKYYDRKEQGTVADYVIIMGYDEHFSGDKEAGSVASLPFVKEGIEQTLEEVPADKIINGIPFYTRLWKVADSGAVSSEVMGMDQAADYVANHGVETFWDKEASQNYGEVYTDNATYKVWIEDEQSIEEKMKLIQQYELAGVAEWKLGFERADVWDIISKYVS